MFNRVIFSLFVAISIGILFNLFSPTGQAQEGSVYTPAKRTVTEYLTSPITYGKSRQETMDIEARHYQKYSDRLSNLCETAWKAEDSLCERDDKECHNLIKRRYEDAKKMLHAQLDFEYKLRQGRIEK
jgi:hypothetical protein